MKALVINTNGECRIVESEWRYEQINETVGGWIEGLSLNGAGYMYLNEEGKLLKLTPNDVATDIARYCYHGNFNDCIVGNAVIFGPSDFEGNDTSVLSSIINYAQKKGWLS